MRSMFHCQARVVGSNASSPPSASAMKNWIAKNGFPPVFSCTSCARGRTRSGSQCMASELADIVESKRRQHDLLNPRSSLADRLQGPRKRVGRTDLVVPVGSDQKQMPHFRMRDQMLEEIERCGVQPLQIVEEQRERVLLAREHP